MWLLVFYRWYFDLACHFFMICLCLVPLLLSLNFVSKIVRPWRYSFIAVKDVLVNVIGCFFDELAFGSLVIGLSFVRDFSSKLQKLLFFGEFFELVFHHFFNHFFFCLLAEKLTLILGDKILLLVIFILKIGMMEWDDFELITEEFVIVDELVDLFLENILAPLHFDWYLELFEFIPQFRDHFITVRLYLLGHWNTVKYLQLIFIY